MITEDDTFLIDVADDLIRYFQDRGDITPDEACGAMGLAIVGLLHTKPKRFRELLKLMTEELNDYREHLKQELN